jgi:RNA polymerase sigma-70 factor (ECF subfamily)
MVFNLANHFLRDPPVAEELAQEVFLELFRTLGRLSSAAHMVFWLRRVTSRCIDEQRRAGRRPEVAMSELPEQAVPPDAGDPLREERLRRLVRELPPAARMVMILRYQEDLEPTEIADILGMRLNTVKSHLRRSLAVVRNRLAEEETLP